MKLTAFLLLAACLHISAKGLSQQITLSEKGAPLKKVLREVARQAGISVVYDEAQLAATYPVTISVKNVSVQAALDKALAGQPFSYKVDGSRITLVRASVENTAAADSSITVTGKVTDEKGDPIPGATIRVQGTNTGTAADVNGHFSLKVPSPKSQLAFSFIGYNQQVLQASANPMNIKLALSSTSLTETVVVGYGVQKKSVVTGSISSIKSSEFENQPVTRVEQVLQGRTSGVTVVSSSGQPGSASSVRIRGNTSFNNNDPLWVVDGVVVDNGGVSYLNQSDIESMEVLKDAASAAIYGTRAANGVILITTKKGKEGKLRVNYNGYVGTSAPARKLNLLNATEYATLINEGLAADGKAPKYANPASLGAGTDWQDLIFNNNAFRQNHEISLSGGNDRSTFYTSFGFMKQEGIVASDISKYQRATFRINSSHKIAKWLTFGENLSYAYEKNSGLGNTNSEFGGPLSSAINLDPITPAIVYDKTVAANAPYTNTGVVRDAFGNPYGISDAVKQEITNPLAYIQTRLGNYSYSHNLVGNAYLEAEPIAGLKLRSTFGGKMAFYGSDNFVPVYYLNSSTTNARTSFTRDQNNNRSWNLENTISYSRTIKQHDFSVLVGQGAYQDGYLQNTNVAYFGIPATTFHDASLNYKIANTNKTAGGKDGLLHTVASYFGRVNYNYAEKYLLTGIIRRDGSSRFPTDRKYGVFPSVSAGWVPTKEAFFPENDVIDFLKIRGGYGSVGNDYIVDNGNLNEHGYLSTIGDGRNYNIGNEILVGNSPNAPANVLLHWEETHQTNIGFDLAFLKHFNFTFDWFNKKTVGILMNPRVPTYTGAYSNPPANVADNQNRGIDLELGYHGKVGEVQLNVNGNASYVKNKSLYLGDGVQYITTNQQTFQSSTYPITRTVLGNPLNAFYGFKTAGIFQNQAEVDGYVDGKGNKIQPNAKPGDFRWVDANGDGAITEADRQVLGNPMPTWTYGLNISATYKNFDINLFAQGAGGNKIFQGLKRLDIKEANMQNKALGRWTGEGTSNTYPRMTLDDPNRNYSNPSDFYLEDGDYLRLKVLQIGYTLSNNIMKRIGAQRLRVFVTGENLFTFTKYTGFDPEIGGAVSSIDRGIYPQARSYMFGLNVTF
ncbi:TonB-dependent receptor [Chitinophaga sp. sic0106]|uniref:TonB-dependent receptor n=1 Tax=Chitinophaga sp. sic0106 TaxID=2854785 RepID=UPI001C496426|nr:TonB-dependent receptor [Chitinophaga sp. sic0106]MBV7529086.1 TonB-dependent receptor [Chitinophaga sp. sic0106]